MKNLFLLMGPKRCDLSGLPFGFLLIVLPRPARDVSGLVLRFAPMRCAFSFGFYWYPWWQLPCGHSRLLGSIPRIQVQVATA